MKKVAVINDISGFGKCSMTAALPIISSFNISAVPIPTSVFSKQTAFSDYISFDLSSFMKETVKSYTTEEFDGIYTGFFSSEEQIVIARDFIASHGETKVVLVDPVLGDDGKAYKVMTDNMIDKLRCLIKYADVITPNITELFLLCNKPYSEIISDEDIVLMANSLMNGKLKTVIVTGIHSSSTVSNIVISENGYKKISSNAAPMSFSGTGDIFSSIIVGSLISKKSALSATITATQFIENAINETYREDVDPRYGIDFEKFLYMLK